MSPQLVRGLIGGAVMSAVMVALIRHFTPPAVVPSPTPIASPVAAGETAAGPQQRAVRDVTPQGVARVYMPAAANLRPRGRVARSIEIKKAGAIPNGSIVGDGRTVRMYGIAFPDVKKICATASGERWPCGRRAYIALHNKVVAQTVSCEPRVDAELAAADCFVDEVNLAVWLLSEGLVSLAAEVADKELMAAEATAKTARLGLWSDTSEVTPSAQAKDQSGFTQR